jgi:hypothetical protein
MYLCVRVALEARRKTGQDKPIKSKPENTKADKATRYMLMCVLQVKNQEANMGSRLANTNTFKQHKKPHILTTTKLKKENSSCQCIEGTYILVCELQVLCTSTA